MEDREEIFVHGEAPQADPVPEAEAVSETEPAEQSAEAQPELDPFTEDSEFTNDPDAFPEVDFTFGQPDPDDSDNEDADEDPALDHDFDSFDYGLGSDPASEEPDDSDDEGPFDVQSEPSQLVEEMLQPETPAVSGEPAISGDVRSPRMSGEDLKAKLRQERREKRLAEKGY